MRCCDWLHQWSLFILWLGLRGWEEGNYRSIQTIWTGFPKVRKSSIGRTRTEEHAGKLSQSTKKRNRKNWHPQSERLLSEEKNPSSTSCHLEGHRAFLCCKLPQFSFIWGKRFSFGGKVNALPLPLLSCFCSRRKGHGPALSVHRKITMPAFNLFRVERNSTFTERKTTLRVREVLMNEISPFLPWPVRLGYTITDIHDRVVEPII